MIDLNNQQSGRNAFGDKPWQDIYNETGVNITLTNVIVPERDVGRVIDPVVRVYEAKRYLAQVHESSGYYRFAEKGNGPVAYGPWIHNREHIASIMTGKFKH